MYKRQVEGKERVGKGEGGLDLDICPAAPEFLVTPLIISRLLRLHRHSVIIVIQIRHNNRYNRLALDVLVHASHYSGLSKTEKKQENASQPDPPDAGPDQP